MTRVIERAVAFAVHHHRDQTRKHSGLPYVTHPLDVLKRLASWGVRREEQGEVWIAAVLHDVVEDCGVSLKTIGLEFGLPVMRIVRELTFDGDGSNYAYLDTFKIKSPQAILVKAADRLCNAEDFATWGDAGYALKYLRKGRPVFEAAIDRSDEIDDVFGVGVYVEMCLDHAGVLDRLSRR